MHRFVQSYAVDGEPVQNPLWLHGNRLSIEVLTVSVAEHLCTAFRHAASKAGVEIVGVVLESVGMAHATLSQDERDMGVALLDLGAGTCDLAVFLGPMRHLEEIPLGGDDITRDLSVVLSIPIREAEKLKCRFGSVSCPGEDGDEAVTYHTTAGRTCTLTKQQVSAVIEARQREIFEYVRQALINSSYNDRLAAGIVLTAAGPCSTKSRHSPRRCSATKSALASPKTQSPPPRSATPAMLPRSACCALSPTNTALPSSRTTPTGLAMALPMRWASCSISFNGDANRSCS